MMKLIKTNWPLVVLGVLAIIIMMIIVDMKKNDLPKIKQQEKEQAD